MIPSLEDLFSADEVPHRTLLSVVNDQEMVDKMIEIVKGVIGNLDDPDTGFLFVVPVIQAMGLGRSSS